MNKTFPKVFSLIMILALVLMALPVETSPGVICRYRHQPGVWRWRRDYRKSVLQE